MKAVLAILAVGFVAAMATPVKEIRIHRGPNQCEPPEDPQIIEPGNMNISLAPVIELLEGSTHQGLVVAGLSGLETDINIIIITLTLQFKVRIPSLDVAATGYDGSGYLDTRPFTSIPVGNFTGTGDATVQIAGLNVEGSATLFINIIGNRVNIRVLNVAVFSFDVLCLDFGPDFRIGGNPVDFVDFCANVKTRFDAEWRNNNLKNQLVEKIRVAANVIVGRYTLDELIDLIGGGGGGEPCVQKIY